MLMKTKKLLPKGTAVFVYNSSTIQGTIEIHKEVAQK
jgi:hypothetical protein